MPKAINPDANKPEAGKPFTFKMAVTLSDLIYCENMDGMNDMMDNHVWDIYGEGITMCDLSYKAVGVDEDGLIIIEVNAGDVEIDEEEEQ